MTLLISSLTRYTHGICHAFTSTHAYALLLPSLAAVYCKTHIQGVVADAAGRGLMAQTRKILALGLSTKSQTILADMQHEPVDGTATGADDTMGAVDDDFQWEAVPDDLRDNETFMLAV
ncbi:hypothetical protein EDB19DRAFT_1829740 [Suillus lakei]|nr:hypothetical protein EDB19DRAFT_1829740 [Suillus lakei]